MMGRPQGWAHETGNLQGKRILITGGTTGIGRATARLLAEQGADIMIYGRDPRHLQDALKDIQAVAKGKIVGFTADQSDRQEIPRIFQEVDRQLGGIDVLVNNAAQPAESTAEMPAEKIEYVIKSNLLAYLLCAQEAAARMVKHGGGHIVNVGSLSADVREVDASVYVATKSGVQGWNEAFRKEMFKQGIRVSLLELGMVGTNLHGEPPDVPGQQKQTREQTMLTAEDVAEAIHYCLIQPPRCDVLSMQLAPHMQGL